MVSTTTLVLLSDQMALERSVDVIANNIANSSTTGFKRESVAFSTFLRKAAGLQSTSMVYDSATYRDNTPGTISTTGNPLDLAIQGDGYFQVQTPDGVEYTRDGAFRTDNQGQIVTSSGYPVLSDGGQAITLPDEAIDVTISGDGFITAQVGTGSSRAQLGKIGIVKFVDDSQVVSVGSGLLSANKTEVLDTQYRRRGTRARNETANPNLTAVQPIADGDNIQLIQGAIEDSNVKPVLEMTDLIRIQRAYEQASNMIGSQNTSESEAIDKLSATS